MFRANGNRVYVDVSESVPGRTKGGLHLPDDTTVDQFAFGKVVSVGQGVMTAHGWDAPDVKVGERVMFDRRSVAGRFIDKDKFIAWLMWSEVIGVERNADIHRANGKPQLVESN
jgi:co-chaperonin GroES (HSP10)